MIALTIFSSYRRLLLLFISIYTILKVLHAIWTWRGFGVDDRHQALFRRYLELTLLRIRLRRFWFELLELAGMAIVLGWLVMQHDFPGG